MGVCASCFEGPSIVHELLRPMRESHTSKFLPSCSEGNDHLEVSVQLCSNELRRMLVVFQHSYHQIVNGLAYYLVGDAPGEPPERLLFAQYNAYLDMARVRQVAPAVTARHFEDQDPQCHMVGWECAGQDRTREDRRALSGRVFAERPRTPHVRA